MIYILNDCVLNVLRDFFELDDKDVYEVIDHSLSKCKQVLSKKGLAYEDLQKALIPTKDLSHLEYAFWFDRKQMTDGFYGREIMSRILPAMDKKSSYSVLQGDYIDVIENNYSLDYLLRLLDEQIHVVNESEAFKTNQYFVVYFNRLTQKEFEEIHKALKPYNWYYGYTELYESSELKSYLSIILVNKFIKHKNYIIMSNPDGAFNEEENINTHWYPYEDNGYKIISIDEENFDTFLSYKIETVHLSEEDFAYSLNALYPKFEYMSDLKFDILDDKWKYLNRRSEEGKKGKGEIMSILADELKDKESFVSYIQDSLIHNYIYKLEMNEYGVLKFSECIGLRTQNGHFRKTLISFMYSPEERKLWLLTII